MKSKNLRAIAASVINDVTNGQSLSDCLTKTWNHQSLSPRDRGFIQAVCYGVCRYYYRLDFILSCLLKKPMKGKDSDIHALLMVGLFQLIAMRVPSHAAVSETVAAVAVLKPKSTLRSLVNAVLREYLRSSEAIDKKVLTDDEALYMHPYWWLKIVQKEWPEDWQKMLAVNNSQPPFALRVNPQQYTRDAYLAILAKAGIAARPIVHTQSGIILDEAIAANELPGFSTGAVSVQDGAAQLAAELLDLKPDQRVLDACAAPGGKLSHMLEIVPHLACVAVEKDPKRMVLIEENLKRLKLNAKCFCSDVSDVKKWWDGQLFDRILLDAPCSASGVVRRHPDIKLLRQPQDIAAFARLQQSLLESLWPLLKPNGILLYATCSIFSAENTTVAKQFLTSHKDAIEISLPAALGVACEVGRQILPGMDEMDGFYYAKFLKRD